MTRLELLRIVVGRARANGFEFRRWYVNRLCIPWISAEAALTALDAQRRYYALLFSHDFARTFWKAGEEITFAVPARSFDRVRPDGTIVNVTRKPYVRRSARPDAWRYHLRQMALAEEPLRYIRKYLHVQDDAQDDTAFDTDVSLKDTARPEHDPDLDCSPSPQTPARNRKPPQAVQAKSAQPTRAAARGRAKTPRPLPTGLPAFLRRPPQAH
jgi:hypothetical protein